MKFKCEDLVVTETGCEAMVVDPVPDPGGFITILSAGDRLLWHSSLLKLKVCETCRGTGIKREEERDGFPVVIACECEIGMQKLRSWLLIKWNFATEVRRDARQV